MAIDDFVIFFQSEKNFVMGIEVRRVPAGWEHPKNISGHYIPLLDRSYSEAVSCWDEEKAMWDKGLRRHYGAGEWVPVVDDDQGMAFEALEGECPEKDDSSLSGQRKKRPIS